MGVQKIAENVRSAGGRTFLVGGSVRDRLLGRESSDIDLMVAGVPAETLERILPGKVDFVGKQFGVYKVTFGGETYDVALPRSESYNGELRADPLTSVRPCHSISVEEDLSRRDFTVNAIAQDVLTGELVDPFGGEADVRRRRIVAVGNPEERFREDPLRMLRAVRFMSQLGFDLDPSVAKVIAEKKHWVQALPAERLGKDLSRLLMGDDADAVLAALRALRDTGFLAQIIPEWEASIGFDQRNPHHCYTVDEHVFAAVHHAVRKGASERARWAVFLHDIAKPATYTFEGGCGRFYGHEKKGAEMAAQILRRLRFPLDDTKAISLMVREHLRPAISPEGEVSDRALRRYVATMGDLVEDSLECREADLAAHAGWTYETALEAVNSIRARVRSLDEVIGFQAANLALRGDEIVRLFGVKGPEIGRLKAEGTKAVVDGLVPNEREALIEFLRPLTQNTA